MGTLVKNLFFLIKNSIHLFKIPYNFKKKIYIIYKYFSFLFLLNVFSKRKYIKFDGMKIKGFSYKLLFILYKEIFIKGTYWFHTNKADHVIIDGGANIGMATIFFKWIYPEIIIYSFEPDKETFKVLEKNIFNNNIKGVFLYNYALSDYDGEGSFYSNNDGSMYMSILKDRVEGKENTIKFMTLSKLITEKWLYHIDLLKLDIEGAEYNVIGDISKNNIIQKIDEFIIEYHHNIKNQKSKLGNFLNYFEQAGFKFHISDVVSFSKSKLPIQDFILNI